MVPTENLIESDFAAVLGFGLMQANFAVAAGAAADARARSGNIALEKPVPNQH
jgi:hypothetical protein